MIKELENFFSDKEQKYIDYWEIGKVSHLMYQLIDNNSDFDDEEYVYILNDFFEMSKKHKLQNNNRSIRLFYFLRKYFSDKTSFRISQQLRNIYIFLKSFIKAN